MTGQLIKDVLNMFASIMKVFERKYLIIPTLCEAIVEVVSVYQNASTTDLYING